MSHEHCQRQRVHDNAFPAWLDEMSAEGWELAFANQVGVAMPAVAASGQSPQGWPVLICVFRRPKDEAIGAGERAGLDDLAERRAMQAAFARE